MAVRQRIAALLKTAGVDAPIHELTTLGIGSAGLAARGNRDEDGTHTRVVLDDGTSLVYREYETTTRMAAHYMHKELAVFDALRAAGLPSPDVLVVSEDPPAALLSDGGGEPLEELFLRVGPGQRSAIWRTVGALLKRFHELPVDGLSFLTDPSYARPWTSFLPYFVRSLRTVKATRPDLGPHVDTLLGLRGVLQAYLDTRPRTLTFNLGYYLPGVLLTSTGGRFACTSWLSLGYYVWTGDPALDLMAIAVVHREWTGQDVPPSFYKGYGSRVDDPVCELLYEARIQLGRGATYYRGKYRKGWGPPPHSTALQALEQLPDTVARLRDLLRE